MTTFYLTTIILRSSTPAQRCSWASTRARRQSQKNAINKTPDTLGIEEYYVFSLVFPPEAEFEKKHTVPVGRIDVVPRLSDQDSKYSSQESPKNRRKDVIFPSTSQYFLVFPCVWSPVDGLTGEPTLLPSPHPHEPLPSVFPDPGPMAPPLT